jgi:hypothetical protein
MNPPERTDSDQFEKELDDFFKERAEFRSSSFFDQSKSKTLIERDSDLSSSDSILMSGCCMTGCYDCPWDYRPS